ncbi:unnamed protein product [Caenorhabditis brenneri]
MASAFHWSNDFGLTAQNEIQGRSSQKILRTKIQKVIESSHKALVDGASFNIPASKDSIQLVDFLRVYRTWLLMTDCNNIREIDDTMGQEIRYYNQREDGAPVKRIRVSKRLQIPLGDILRAEMKASEDFEFTGRLQLKNYSCIPLTGSP